jgi:hypothetical protein
MTELALFEALALDCRVGTDGTVRYYNSSGQLHRVYGPAIEYPSGRRDWYQNGRLHRVDGPAIERPNSPAAEYSDGDKIWYQNGLLHRLDGPAVEYSDGTYEWWLNGKELTQAQWRQEVASMEAV